MVALDSESWLKRTEMSMDTNAKLARSRPFIIHLKEIKVNNRVESLLWIAIPGILLSI
jgi:hypothetical protein